MNCNSRCLTCAFCNSTVFKSSKLCFFSPKLSKFKTLFEIMSKDCSAFKATQIWTQGKTEWIWTKECTSSLLSAFGPISTILYAFSKLLTEIPMNKGSLSSIDKPWGCEFNQRQNRIRKNMKHILNEMLKFILETIHHPHATDILHFSI